MNEVFYTDEYFVTNLMGLLTYRYDNNDKSDKVINYLKFNDIISENNTLSYQGKF